MVSGSWEAACSESALCEMEEGGLGRAEQVWVFFAVFFVFFGFFFFNTITHGPVDHSCPAGAAQLQVRPSGGVNKCALPCWHSIRIESMVATCLLC